MERSDHVMRCWNKIISVCLVVLLFCGMAPGAIMPAHAQYYGGRIGDNITWVLDTESGLLEIEGSGDAPDDINLPPWYDYRTAIRTVTIQNGITSVWLKAFLGCTNLTEVTLPDTLKIIETYAFRECTSLRSVQLPDGLEEIWTSAFSASGLESIYIPDSVTAIGESCFSGSRSLRYVHLPEGMESIPPRIFMDCTSLKVIDFPSTLKHIGESGLMECASLEQIDLPPAMEDVDFETALYTPYVRDPSNWKDGCLYSGSVLLAVDPALKGTCVVKDGTTCIAHHAFQLHNGTKFVDNPNLCGVVLPDSVRYLPPDAFSPSLQTICYAGTPDQWYDLMNGVSRGIVGNYYTPVYTIHASVIFHAHTDDELRYAETLEPTCVADGGTGGVTYYAGCCTIKEAAQILPALGHEVSQTPFGYGKLDPSPHIDGYEYWLCSRCNQSYYTILPGVGHSFKAWTTNCASTCTQQGSQSCKCSNCYTYKHQLLLIDPDNHARRELRGEKPAGCTEAGYSGDTYCADCGILIETGATVPPSGHSYSAVVTAPTCQKGFTTYTCSRCGDSYSDDEVPAAAQHIWDDGIITLAPTETEEGVLTFTCTVCGQTMTQSVPSRTPPVLNHTTLRLCYKETADLSASVPVTWRSSDPSVVQVQSDGRVTAVGKGAAVVTAEDTQSGSTAECSVEVYYAWWQHLIRIFLFGFLWY